jgi:hypothetical protein
MLRSHEEIRNGSATEKRINLTASKRWDGLSRFLTALMRALSVCAV